MARAINKLSARFVATVTEPGRHSDGAGLYLAVTTSGARKWVFMFRFDGKQREMGLGSARDVPLAKAREKAAEVRAILAEGRNPLEVRRAAQAETARLPTFGQVADAHIDGMEAGWRNPKHVAQWRMTLGDTYCATIRQKPVDQVSTDDVVSILRPIWLSKAETAARLRGRIEAVLSSAKVQGHRTGENPATWRGHLALLLPPRKKLQRGHHPALEYKQMPGFIAKLRAANGVAARALEFLIATAARTGEITGATWGEFDFDQKVWVIPAERMKSGRTHRVPLTDRALEVVEGMKVLRLTGAPDEVVFPGRKDGSTLSDMSLKAVLKRLGHGSITSHGFRSSFRDWAGDATSFPRDLAEAALAHAVGDQTERAYRRGDALARRREMMEAWSRFCEPKDSSRG